MTPKLTLTLLLLIGACGGSPSAEAEPPEEAVAPPPAEPDAAVRFSFAVNGLEHGNGAL